VLLFFKRHGECRVRSKTKLFRAVSHDAKSEPKQGLRTSFPPVPVSDRLKMSKTRNILRLKKRSRALPSSPWLGHDFGFSVFRLLGLRIAKGRY
jgi:hypothetical protein